MGLEYIVQPQVFLGGLTALGPGIQGLTEQYPLLTTYYSWTSTASVNISSFPIPIDAGSIYGGPGKESSFIVSVGGVVQSPTQYTVDSILRTITFNTTGSVISAGIEFAVTQLATAAPSSQNFNFLKSVSAEFTTLTSTNGSFNNLIVTNLTAFSGAVNSLVVTNLTALSTTVNVIDIRVTEVSGFRATGDVDVLGNVNVTNNITSINATLTSLTATNLTVLSPISGLYVGALSSDYLTVLNPVTLNSLNVTTVSATGNISAANLSKYFILSADTGSKSVNSGDVAFFETNGVVDLEANKNYKLNYDLYFYNPTGSSPLLCYILSASNTLNSLNSNFITTNAQGISGNSQTPVMGSTFGINSLLAKLPQFPIGSSIAGNSFQNSLIQAIVQTGNACTLNLIISGTSGSITPKRGSSRIVQLME
jgi:hypothetical protein